MFDSAGSHDKVLQVSFLRTATWEWPSGRGENEGMSIYQQISVSINLSDLGMRSAHLLCRRSTIMELDNIKSSAYHPWFT
jgi:hypothetical protein